ncbi:type I glyceraldehyde-3-phosphate dehydrogenase [Candidatus Bathyarchaeota archaeon]|nr:MAG: type I glyceraldehyde-3-phosphate dehydrogenase [Candidatus Bathyarchaeota archaeon]
MRVAVNGFGRIGRSFYRALLEENSSDIEVSVINSTSPPRTLAHLLKYDSTYGTLPLDVGWDSEGIRCAGKKVPCLSETNQSKIDWEKFDVDAVLESTGQRLQREELETYISNGAHTVLVSAPSEEADVTLIPGCNLETYDRSHHRIISMGSCTTNCLALCLKVLDDNFGVARGFATTVHSYTSDQRLLDGSHEDLRRARSAGQSLIPTRTGASQTIGKVLPRLKGKITCSAIRAPTSTVSLLDLVVKCSKDVNRNEVNNAYSDASTGGLRGILAVSNEPLVSIDYKKNPHSAIVDELSTGTNGSMVRVLAWYDNEWAYATRLVDTFKRIERPALMPQISSQKSPEDNRTAPASLNRRTRRAVR